MPCSAGLVTRRGFILTGNTPGCLDSGDTTRKKNSKAAGGQIPELFSFLSATMLPLFFTTVCDNRL